MKFVLFDQEHVSERSKRMVNNFEDLVEMDPEENQILRVHRDTGDEWII